MTISTKLSTSETKIFSDKGFFSDISPGLKEIMSQLLTNKITQLFLSKKEHTFFYDIKQIKGFCACLKVNRSLRKLDLQDFELEYQSAKILEEAINALSAPFCPDRFCSIF